MLQLPETDLKKTRFYQQVFGEGHREGHQKGQREGLVEGQHIEVLTLVRRLLARRFPELDEAQRPSLEALTTEQLEDLAEAMLEFNDPADLGHWLQRLSE